MRPGIAVRQAELPSMIAAVGKHRPLQSIVPGENYSRRLRNSKRRFTGRERSRE